MAESCVNESLCCKKEYISFFEVTFRSSHNSKCSVYVLTREVSIMPKEVKLIYDLKGGNLKDIS